ncbi:hypothetical protein [Marinobacterium sp. MBR-109]|jgi:hypothetical protein|uniref:hypothetical protein n=1 Tax=Marinobacterium sp. MBR-109 TaxID=3156462 RepID=UPI003391D5CF
MADTQEWHGRNRRTQPDRRTNTDRREDIRFEPDKKDRRKNRGRRKEDKDPWLESINQG